MATEAIAEELSEDAAQTVPNVIEFDDLGLPDFVDNELAGISLPESIVSLDGQAVELRVYMLPDSGVSGRATWLNSVPVVHNDKPSRVKPQGNAELRRMRYLIQIQLTEGSTIEFNRGRYVRPLLIRGTLRIEEDDKIQIEGQPWPYLPFVIENATWQPAKRRHGDRPQWFFSFPC
ncbi:MAG: hypothetical protein DWQ34_19570 [Planctomycetota bacterium]|nr:MAG: hypothetical protein DWQ34_19570 [Planctomycetota bacterium]REK39594.1 MAG: hypothetical protein DWQ45_01595 [Planctomycetota bacterium]